MAFGARSTPSKPKDDPVEGGHSGRLVGIVDLGMQPAFEYQGETVDAHYQVRFTYELPASLMEDGRPHWVSEDMKNSDFYKSMNQSSKMMKRVYALDPRGEKSNKGKDLRPLLGCPCNVAVGPNDRGYTTINNVTAATIGAQIGELQNPAFISTFDEPNLDVWNKLPKFVQEKIQKALDFPGSNLEKALLAAGEIGNEVDTDGKGY